MTNPSTFPTCEIRQLGKLYLPLKGQFPLLMHTLFFLNKLLCCHLPSNPNFSLCWLHRSSYCVIWLPPSLLSELKPELRRGQGHWPNWHHCQLGMERAVCNILKGFRSVCDPLSLNMIIAILVHAVNYWLTVLPVES